MQCEEWDDENSELFKESHDETVHKNSYKSRLYELISASLVRDAIETIGSRPIQQGDFSTSWRLCKEPPSQPKLARRKTMMEYQYHS